MVRVFIDETRPLTPRWREYYERELESAQRRLHYLHSVGEQNWSDVDGTDARLLEYRVARCTAHLRRPNG